MKRNGMIAAAALLAFGTVAVATDASAEGRHGMSVRTTGNTGARMNAGTNFHSNSGNVGLRTGYARDIGVRRGYGSNVGVRGGYARTATYTHTRTGLNTGYNHVGGEWRHHRRYGGGWGPGFGVGVGYADYGYDNWGPDYGYADVGYGYDDIGYGYGPAYAGYGGGCSCGAPAYGYGYAPGYAYAGPAIGIGFGFGGWGGGWGHHRHW
jgi:hypothetical protein